MRYGTLVAFFVVAVFGCDDSATESSAGMDAGRVPFDGAVMPAPDATIIDERSFYPLFNSAQWRYRKKTDEWQSPPTVTEGAEALTSNGPADGEFIRQTTVYVDLVVGDETQVIRQTIDEVFVLEQSNMRVGPILKVKGIVIDERVAADDTLVRRTERTYFPAYTFIADTWRTGTISTRIEEDIHLTEMVTTLDMETACEDDEPCEDGACRGGQCETMRETRGMIRLEVITEPTPVVLPMEGRYREGVHEVSVADHFSGTVMRRYWLQQAVGPVQWQFQFSGNTTYTLMESNVEMPTVPAE